MARANESDYAVIAAPFGRIAITLREGAVVDVSFTAGDKLLQRPRTASGRRVCAQLRRYFSDPAASFDVALTFEATAHQRRVWRTLRRIPAGTVVSYGELARRLGSSPRAIGGACRANPVPIIIPCHRVVSASGLGGFMGRTGGQALRIKRWLLEHERAG